MLRLFRLSIVWLGLVAACTDTVDDAVDEAALRDQAERECSEIWKETMQWVLNHDALPGEDVDGHEWLRRSRPLDLDPWGNRYRFAWVAANAGWIHGGKNAVNAVVAGLRVQSAGPDGVFEEGPTFEGDDVWTFHTAFRDADNR